MLAQVLMSLNAHQISERAEAEPDCREQTDRESTLIDTPTRARKLLGQVIFLWVVFLSTSTKDL